MAPVRKIKRPKNVLQTRRVCSLTDDYYRITAWGEHNHFKKEGKLRTRR